MGRFWRLLTPRGRVFLVLGLGVVVGAMLAGQRDVMRLGLLLAALPVVALVLVAVARLRLSCERSVEPDQVQLGSAMHGRIVLGQEGRLPAGLVLMEDQVPHELGTAPRFCVDKPGQAWQREVEYPLLGRVRGRFHTGPLTVRTADPFKLVQLDRRFVATSEVLVTPQIVPLASLRGAGGVGSAGDAQPHRIGVVGQDDVLVREYRQGDDVRRVHWRTTARRGELMVRREEQAWDPSVSIVLDSRTGAHAGEGIWSSFEWSVSAACSIALHFIDAGFGVEIFEAGGSLRIATTAGQPAVARQAVVSRLTDLRSRSTRTLQYAVNAATLERSGQLVVAICGRLTVEDAEGLRRLRRNRAQGMALLLDVDSFRDGPGGQGQEGGAQLGWPGAAPGVAEDLLRDDGWKVVPVRSGLGVADAWAAFDSAAAGAR
ncbi:uncharacterized protein (DUF58 family) [Friedmanniella endophytica]|uniref:Uncharacterized protein (DUF58 family) n=1 Tax=Microlunatus kandeliicorticis TaxID=1759536 RepID=A0A7W3ISA2_9ACTN|nr:DUF58 domain-containing protein [Microlunatus kandeliicorticis]MBA8794321.1 uncharacterized protein (DUF58 family) [Microlunatus kandeliicorticis]